MLHCSRPAALFSPMSLRGVQLSTSVPPEELLPWVSQAQTPPLLFFFRGNLHVGVEPLMAEDFLLLWSSQLRKRWTMGCLHLFIQTPERRRSSRWIHHHHHQTPSSSRFYTAESSGSGFLCCCFTPHLSQTLKGTIESSSRRVRGGLHCGDTP